MQSAFIGNTCGWTGLSPTEAPGDRQNLSFPTQGTVEGRNYLPHPAVLVNERRASVGGLYLQHPAGLSFLFQPEETPQAELGLCKSAAFGVLR